jgi:uncharacterized protein YbcI
VRVGLTGLARTGRRYRAWRVKDRREAVDRVGRAESGAVILGGAARRELMYAQGMHLALLAVRRLSLFPALDHFLGKGEKGRIMATETSSAGRLPGSSLPSTISTAIVRLMREYTGRGPMKAQTTIRENVVLVMLEQTLTKGEQVLVNKGRGENVLALRHEYQEAMRDESSDTIAELTGRTVTAMMSANHLAPDLAAEIYVLDGPPVHLEGSSPASSAV